MVSLVVTLSAWVLSFESDLAKHLSTLDQTELVHILLGLVVVTLLSLAAYFYYKPKLVISQEDGGCWKDLKTGYRYCVACLATHNKLVPLSLDKDRWIFHNGCPGHYQIQKPPKESGQDQCLQHKKKLALIYAIIKVGRHNNDPDSELVDSLLDIFDSKQESNSEPN